MVISQLLGRLTWRDSYGVAVVLSRNAGFSEVLMAVRETIPATSGFSTNTFHERTANHFVARFSLPSDETRTVSIHVLVYNLYVAEAGKRVVKRRKRSES